jgi:hypothetical protein
MLDSGKDKSREISTKAALKLADMFISDRKVLEVEKGVWGQLGASDLDAASGVMLEKAKSLSPESPKV